ncbi:hypothetical protein [Flavobacterium ajazii]|uniref:hypothetical protein n=1 Tax=Flavobacterium ajazii TaxID=2692318 RepID=UPI0013D4985C|nr:hypothetical protein [Flavobacterium ajazii]
MYKKAEPVCLNFEELLSSIILPLVIVSYVSYPVMYFFGIMITVFFNGVMTFMTIHFHKGLKKFIPILNVNSEEAGLKPACYRIFSFLLIFTVLLIADFGFYLLVLYQKKNEFSLFLFCSWLFILFGLPMVYYTFKSGQYYYKKKQQDLEFMNIILAINHDMDLFLAVDNIQFVNTVNRNSSDIKIKNNIRYYSHKEFISTKTKNRQYYASKEGFRELVQIPLNTDTVLLSWFSYIENKYYAIEIPFPLKDLMTEPENSPIDKFKVFRKETKILYLHLYLNGGVKFFYKDMIVIDCPDNAERVISEEDKKMKFGMTN